MTSINEKVDYVRSQPQTRMHECHWPGCTRQVPPAMWGCTNHWRKLPRGLRTAIWRTFRPGQEVTRDPSKEYVDVALRVREWILKHYPPKKQQETLL